MCDFFEDNSAKVEWQFGNYAILNNIGRGSFGEVRLARHLITSTMVAVKIVNCEHPEDVAKEIYCLKELNHPNIVKLFEVVNTNHQVYMFMEHACGGTLYRYLKKCGPFSETAARAPFRQMLSAVHYCHQKHIVHRDIKPENLLLDMGLNIKLADFGLSAVFREEKLTTFCGTPNYKAPELFRLEPYEGPKVDVWSMGVVLYKMLTGVRPFVGKTLEQLTEHILSGDFSVPSFLSGPCHTLLKTMINIDPGRRPTLGVIMQDSWVNTGEAVEMTPYIEPPCTALDPQVTRIMRTLGYEQEEIESSLTERKFNSVMGTYCILDMKLTIGSRTIKVSPRSSSDSNMTISTTPWTWGSWQKGRQPRNPPPSPEFNVSAITLPGSLDLSIATPPIRVEVKRVIVQQGSEHLENINQAGSVHLEKTSQPASAHLQKTSQGGSVDLEKNSHPASAHLQKTSLGGSVHLEKTSQPASAHLEKTSQGGSVDLEKNSHPASAHLQKTSLGGSVHLEKTSQPASAHLEKTSQGGSVDLEKNSHPASAHLEKTSQAGSTHLQKTSQPASAHLQKTSQPGSEHLESTSQPASAHLQKTSQPASAHLQKNSQPGSEHLESTSQPDTRDLRNKKLRPALQGDSKVFPATQSSSSPRSCSGGTEVRTTTNGQAGPSCEETLASSSDHSQRRKGVARRVLGFFKRFLCCTGETKKRRIKITQVVPM